MVLFMFSWSDQSFCWYDYCILFLIICWLECNCHVSSLHSPKFSNVFLSFVFPLLLCHSHNSGEGCVCCSCLFPSFPEYAKKGGAFFFS